MAQNYILIKLSVLILDIFTGAKLEQLQNENSPGPKM